jgi:predicted nucleic acid-binding protein
MRVFWDTNLFIYLWENSVLTEKAMQLVESYSSNGDELCTSSLSFGEIVVKPFSDGTLDMVEAYVRRFTEIEVLPFGQQEAVTFARLRSQFPSLKPPDAIQLSCALENGVANFVTNNDRLNRLDLEAMSIFSLEEVLSALSKGSRCLILRSR